MCTGSITVTVAQYNALPSRHWPIPSVGMPAEGATGGGGGGEGSRNNLQADLLAFSVARQAALGQEETRAVLSSRPIQLCVVQGIFMDHTK
jgi:hypothetical protein